MRTAVCRTLVVGLLVVCAAMSRAADPEKVYNEEEAWRIGWPMLGGSCGNFLTLRTGAKITDDLSQAELLWISEERDFGSAKTGSKTFSSAGDVTARLGPGAAVHPGSWAGVIIAEGKVFASSFRPAGPAREAKVKDEAAKFRLDAEDLVFALDARTGKTLWKTAEPGGLMLSGGKRGGFQVAPAYFNGRVFSMGSTGRVFAHDAATGRKLWQGDIGPVHQQVAKVRAKILAAAEQGKWTDPDGPGWHTSLVVADGVLIVPTYSDRDTGLRGVDVATGQTKWEIKNAVSKWATPSVWRHGDRECILCATVSGVLRLIDPRDGRELWKVTALGSNYFTLAPSATHVLVNVAGPVDAKAKRVPGWYGAYRITPASAELAWKMPQEPQYQLPTWFDSCALQRYIIRDGLVHVSTEGTKEVPGRFLLMKEETGQILAEHVNDGAETNQVTGLFYLVEDRLIGRTNSNHGSTHGGRHPVVQWRIGPGKVERLDVERRLAGMDLAEFTNAYEVYMETPIVAGRMFERTEDGRLACYGLRRKEGLTGWSVDLLGGYIGMLSLPLRVWARGGEVIGGRALPPSDKQAALPFSQCRQHDQWERVSLVCVREANENRLAAVVSVGFGSHSWPIELELGRKADGTVTGTWTRKIAPLDSPVTTAGAVTGTAASKQRIYPTAWLPDRPVTTFGDNPDGTTTWILQLADCITLGKKPAALTISIDHDGQRITRAGATAFGFCRAWHEIDASQLRIADGRIAGAVMVVLNGDWWTVPNAAAGTGVAGRIEIDATAAQGALTGTYKAQLGIPWTASGTAKGEPIP